MSRCYQMSIAIQAKDAGLTKEEKRNLIDALEQEWDWGDFDDMQGIISATGEGNLCAGETEDQFASRCYRAVWTAINKYVRVNLIQTYLEDLPYESYESDEEDFERMMQA